MKETIKLIIPDTETLHGSDEFRVGVIYKCIESPGQYTEWKGAYAWLDATANKRCNCSALQGGKLHHQSVSFVRDYLFEAMPKGTKIVRQHLTEEVLVENR
jgi:hypothetical protein